MGPVRNEKLLRSCAQRQEGDQPVPHRREQKQNLEQAETCTEHSKSARTGQIQHVLEGRSERLFWGLAMEVREVKKLRSGQSNRK